MFFFQKIKFKTFFLPKKRQKKGNTTTTSVLYKVDYKIQDTDGFHKIHVPLLGLSALTYVMRAVWEPHTKKIIKGTTVACFPFQ